MPGHEQVDDEQDDRGGEDRAAERRDLVEGAVDPAAPVEAVVVAQDGLAGPGDREQDRDVEAVEAAGVEVEAQQGGGVERDAPDRAVDDHPQQAPVLVGAQRDARARRIPRSCATFEAAESLSPACCPHDGPPDGRSPAGIIAAIRGGRCKGRSHASVKRRLRR